MDVTPADSLKVLLKKTPEVLTGSGLDYMRTFTDRRRSDRVTLQQNENKLTSGNILDLLLQVTLTETGCLLLGSGSERMHEVGSGGVRRGQEGSGGAGDGQLLQVVHEHLQADVVGKDGSPGLLRKKQTLSAFCLVGRGQRSPAGSLPVPRRTCCCEFEKG